MNEEGDNDQKASPFVKRDASCLRCKHQYHANEENQIDPNTNLGAAYLGNPVLAKDDAQQKAIRAFKKALELDSTAPNIAYNLGLIYRDRRSWDTSIGWFQTALEHNPHDKDAQYWIDQINEKRD